MGRGCAGDARWPSAVLLIVVAMAVAAACTASPAAPTTADPSRDKLAQIIARGTLVEYFEPDDAPQSYAVEGATRPAGTRCTPNEVTAAEVTGGNWGDRWDIAYGSGVINATRMEHLWMTQPDYYIPQRFIVRDDAAYQAPSDALDLSVPGQTGP